MVITAESVVVDLAAPDMSRDAFVRVLSDATSPAASEAGAMYNAIVSNRVSPAFCAAIFHHESGWGKLGICAEWKTKSPGNTRSSRTGKGVVLQIPGRGPFVRYDTWADGADDQSFRLTDETYVYHQEGRRTIAQIITRFAPASDNNVPEAYIRAVVADMNRWIEEAPPMTGDMPGVPFVAADSRHYTSGRSGGKWPDRYIFHHTNGIDSLGWLTTNPNSNVSATYLHKRDGTARAQLVRHKDTPHTTGEWNDESLSSEWERLWSDPAQRDIPDTTYRNLAAHLAAVVRVERQRGNPHFAGALRRDQVRDHNDYYSTICPGNLDISIIWRIAADLLAGDAPPPTEQLLIPGNPYGDVAVILGFRDYVTTLGKARNPADINLGILSVFGWPMAVEYRGSDGNSYQEFERAWLQWMPGMASPWDIVLMRRGDHPLPKVAS
jgi:hypothetical protein